MARYIDADALIEFIEARYDITWKDDYEGGIKDACVDIIEKIKNIPTADVVERKRGEWIFNPSDAIEMMFTKPKCSECGFESADGGNYCSNCGADMRKEVEG